MEEVVEQVLMTMRQRLDQQLTLDDLARTANFSKFYFARMFRRVTGVSPRRYLYALRLEEAKRLLVMTTSSVAEISYRVGYSSVGTFTSRFTSSVGVPPAVYRRLGGDVWPQLPAEMPCLAGPYTITGRLEASQGGDGGAVVVGLFPGRIPEGRPARCDELGQPGEWSFRQLPTGCWYVLGVSRRDPFLICTCGPVRVGPEAPTAYITLRLRPKRPVDPPMLAGLTGPPR